MLKLNHNAACLILLIFCYLGLVWLLPYFPTQDGPSHLYNLVILRDLINGGKIWGDFFTYQLKAIPNLGFIILTYPLIAYLSPIVAEKMFISIYVILLLWATHFYFKTFKGRYLPFIFFVFPLFFNFSLMKGFYSYSIAIPLFLIGFSLCWKIRYHSHFYKFLIFNSIALTIFYFHLIPYALFIFSLIIITIVQHKNLKVKILNLIILAITLSPNLIISLFYLISLRKFTLPDPLYLFNIPRFINLLVQLFLFSTANFSRLELVPTSLLMFLVLLFGYRSLKIYSSVPSQLPCFPDYRKAITYLITILVLIYFVAPFIFLGGSFFNPRFPWVILLLALPLLKLPETVFWNRHGTAVIVGVVSFSFVFSAFTLFEQSKKIDVFVRGMQADIPENSFIIPYKTKFPDYGNVDVLLHAASYYGIFKQCVNVGNYEAAFPHFLISFKENLSSFPPPDQIAYRPKTIDWNLYSSIGYVLAWKIEENDLEKLNTYYYIFWQDGPMRIYRRIY
jgi:hypothetical protein